MAGLKIFGGPDGAPQKRATSTASDVVGRFRSGYVTGEGRNARPVALQEWRVTTGDPEVADKIHALLGGEAPKEWDAAGEDNLEVFTEANEVKILLDGPQALRQAMVLYGRKGIVRVSDGEVISYPDDQKGQPDPQAGQSFAERKEEARNGTGAEPRIELWFSLAENPELGKFKFQSGSWSLVSDLAYNGTEDEILDVHEDTDGGKIAATLSLEEVSFVAKNGPRAGQTVSYTKPVVKITGAAS